MQDRELLAGLGQSRQIVTERGSAIGVSQSPEKVASPTLVSDVVGCSCFPSR